MAFQVPEHYRLTHLSDMSDGNNGAFRVAGPQARDLYVIASDGLGWEHVSVSARKRCPTWEEMCFIKSLFWDDEDVVMQLHPKRSEYVNQHPFCLHLWKPTEAVIPTPNPILVGETQQVEVA